MKRLALLALVILSGVNGARQGATEDKIPVGIAGRWSKLNIATTPSR